jgi:lysophospholipase L1-like esterase
MKATCACLLLLALAIGCGGSSSDSAPAATGGAGGSGGEGGAAGSPSGGSAGIEGGPAKRCFADIYVEKPVYVDYDKFSPAIGSHCVGTNHQSIEDVELLVFLGDSITVGTPPAAQSEHYRTRLAEKVTQKWPSAEVKSCAVNGARTRDFFEGDRQIPSCFPAPEPKKTLVVITMGGNDVVAMASKKLGPTEATAAADVSIAEMRAAVEWLKDPANFPNGSHVVFANIYEYTDLTADLSACPAATFIGLSGEWFTGTVVLTRMREQYLKIAVDTGSDMIFMGERFCGHGYRAGDPLSQCYRGPGQENWFDFTCIHPTGTGHGVIAEDFMATIEE